MPCRLIVATAIAAGMSVALLGCTGGTAQTATSSAPVAGPTEGSPKGAPAGPARYPARPVAMADARYCPVTIGHPVPRTKPWRDLLFGWPSAYGNGSLWVGSLLPPRVFILPPHHPHPARPPHMQFHLHPMTPR